MPHAGRMFPRWVDMEHPARMFRIWVQQVQDRSPALSKNQKRLGCQFRVLTDRCWIEPYTFPETVASGYCRNLLPALVVQDMDQAG